MQAGSETEIFCPSQAGTVSVRELGRAWGPGRKQLQAVEQEQGPWGETGLSWAVAGQGTEAQGQTTLYTQAVLVIHWANLGPQPNLFLHFEKQHRQRS